MLITKTHVLNVNTIVSKPSNNDEMISHLKECDTYEYTLFGESVPKNLLQGKEIECDDNQQY